MVEEDVGDCENETVFGAGPPSYEDLVEENSYLRSERSQLYDELAKASIIKPQNTKDCSICNLKHQILVNEVSKEKDQNKKLHIDIDQLKQELTQLNIHGLERSEVSKELEQRLEQSEENLIAATAELLQILPLRIKLNEMRQKYEAITGDILISNNKISEITRERDKMKLSFEMSQKSLNDSEISLEKMSNKVSSLKSEKQSFSNQIFLLNEKVSEYLQIIETQAASLKQQEEKVAQLATDREHWKRKSTSLSKELGRFNGSHLQQESAFAELKEANSVLKSKLKLREEAIGSMVEQSRLNLANKNQGSIFPACISSSPNKKSAQHYSPDKSYYTATDDVSNMGNITNNYDPSEADDLELESPSDGCLNMCGAFSLLSNKSRRRPAYGRIEQ